MEIEEAKNLVRPLKPDTVSIESFEREISELPFLRRRLASLFVHDGRDYASELFGSVLANLPRNIFDEILRIYPVIIFSRSCGFAQRFYSRKKTTLIIFSEDELLKMGWLAGRGVIAHEFCHLIRRDLDRGLSLEDPWGLQREAQTDALCIQMGFKTEIEAVRAYLRRQKGEG
jgi:hypothetical protein